jgi:hypothetical protein
VILLVGTFVVVWLLNHFLPRAITWWVHHLHLNGLGHMKAGKALIFGILQGFLVVVDWVVSLFRDHAQAIQSGAPSLYAVGFIIGVLLLLSGGFGLFRR